MFSQGQRPLRFTGVKPVGLSPVLPSLPGPGFQVLEILLVGPGLFFKRDIQVCLKVVLLLESTLEVVP